MVGEEKPWTSAPQSRLPGQRDSTGKYWVNVNSDGKTLSAKEKDTHYITTLKGDAIGASFIQPLSTFIARTLSTT